MDENDTQDNEEDPSLSFNAAIMQAVKSTAVNLPQLRLLLERRGADMNCVEAASGNSLLHLAVLHSNYNATVHLLNRGCSTDQRNSHGLTAVQLAQRLPDRGAFAVAIQLTDLERRERQNSSTRKEKTTRATISTPFKAAVHLEHCASGLVGSLKAGSIEMSDGLT